MGIAEIRELIKRLAGEGKTIIMASHLLDEVEKVCTHVAILKFGNLLAAGAVDDILVNEDIVEVAAADKLLLQNALAQMNGYQNIKETTAGFNLYYTIGTARLDAINSYCFSQGIILNHLQLKRKSLEAKFLELTNK